MSALVTDIEIKPASLLPESSAPKGMPDLDRMGQRYAPSLSRIASQFDDALAAKIAGFGLEDISVEAGDIDIESFSGWIEKGQKGMVLLRYSASPIGSDLVAALPVSLINSLADIHFGGTGKNIKQSDQFSPAEELFIGRFAEELGAGIKSSWTGIAELKTQLKEIAICSEDCTFLKPHELAVVQPFTLKTDSENDCVVSIIYSMSGLRGVPALAEGDMAATPTNIDPVWHNVMSEAVEQIHLPLRTIFARPEISLRRLMNLEAGDVIPVFMPNRIPVSVAGRLFAHGTVGESNNRVAVKVEEIEKGRKYE